MPLERDYDSGRSGAMSTLGGAETGTRHMKMTQRQKTLMALNSFFRVAEHDGKEIAWNGNKYVPLHEQANYLRSGYSPEYSGYGEDVPRDLRRPVASMGIVRNIVSRFTGMLFAQERKPRIAVPGDPKTEDYLNAQLEYGNFWSGMIQARNFGGAMGSSAIGFRFVQGHLRFETLDPRWTTPEFTGRGYQDLNKLTVQYTYAVEKKQRDGSYKQEWYWYRRVIDRMNDTTWVPVPCKDGKEPYWDYIKNNVVQHGMGEVPYEWVQNSRVEDEIDGDPDCLGCYEAITAIDVLLSEAYSGTINNCDPTLVLTGEQALTLSEIKKGSDNAIRIGNGNATYLELQGAGQRSAIEMVKALEERVYRLAQCVPDSVLFQNGSGEKTELEIKRIFASMYERADALREQYQPPMLRICQKLLKFIRAVTRLQPREDGSYIRGYVFCPKRPLQQPDGDVVEVPRDIGKGEICNAVWPPYQDASWTERETMQRVYSTMVTSDPPQMTNTTAMMALAQAFKFDPLKEIKALQKEKADKEAAEAASASEGEGEEGGDEGADATASGPDTAAWKTALEAGIITLNEYREKALQLGAIPDGDLTMPQYRSKYASLFVAATASVSPKAADIASGAHEGNEQRAQESHEMRKENHEEQKKAREEARANGALPSSGQPGAPGAQGAKPSGGKEGSPASSQKKTPQERPSSAPAAKPSEPKPPAAK